MHKISFGGFSDIYWYMERKCSICKKWNDPKNMTSNGYYCKSCYYNKYHKSRMYRKTSTEYKMPHWIGKVANNPGEFCDKEQEEYLTDFLHVLGWKKSSSGNWYDNKIRDKEGNWLKKVRPYPRITKKATNSIYFNFVRNSDQPLPKVRYTSREPYFTNDELDAIQYDYFYSDKTSSYLAYKYDCPEKEINFVIHRTYKLIKTLLGRETKTNGIKNTT